MTIRIEVLPDSSIEIMRPNGNNSKFLVYENLERAMIVIRYLIRRDLAEAQGNLFVPQAVKEARVAFKQLSERNGYNSKKSSAGPPSRR